MTYSYKDLTEKQSFYIWYHFLIFSILIEGSTEQVNFLDRQSLAIFSTHI